MKVYTEIVYTWNDNKGELVEESSKSYDYEGEITKCDVRKKTQFGVTYSVAHSHGSLGDVIDTIAGGIDDLGGAITGGAGSVWTAAETAARVAKEKTTKAWTGMQNMASDWWDKGAEGITELWAGTGLEDMAARWTDKAAMKESWMPGKWDWDSSFQSRWMMGIDMRKKLGRMQGFDWRDYKRDLYADFDTFTANATAAALDAAAEVQAGIDAAAAEVQAGIDAANDADMGDIGDIGSDIGNIGDIEIPSLGDAVDTITGGIGDTGEIIGDVIGNVVTGVEEGVGEVGDILNVDEIVSGVGDVATGVGETVISTVEDLGSDISGGIENIVQNVEGGIADNSGVLGDLEDNINANISGINEDIETGIAENTITLGNMEDTINSNIADANVAVGNLQDIVHDTTSIINKNVLDPLLNIGNENSLIRNPTGWYENAFHNWSVTSVADLPGGGGSFDQGLIEQGATTLGNILGGELVNFGNVFGGILGDIYPSGDDGAGGGSASNQLAASRRNRQGLEGDPFGNPSETRRLVPWTKTFRSKQRNTAPSLINAYA